MGTKSHGFVLVLAYTTIFSDRVKLFNIEGVAVVQGVVPRGNAVVFLSRVIETVAVTTPRSQDLNNRPHFPEGSAWVFHSRGPV